MKPNTTLKIGETLYGTNEIERVVPLKSEIPAEFFNPENKWVKIAHKLFWYGVEKSTTIFPKKGYNAEEVKRHISCILNIHGDFIKLNYKLAAAAYLLDMWTEQVY